MRTRPPTTRVSILYCQGSVSYKMKWSKNQPVALVQLEKGSLV